MLPPRLAVAAATAQKSQATDPAQQAGFDAEEPATSGKSYWI